MANQIQLPNEPLKKWHTFSNEGVFSPIRVDQLSEHFHASEFDCNKELIIAECLIDALEEVRLAWGKPMKINSGYRSLSKQEQLISSGARAATTSPHGVGMAADIDTHSFAESRALAECIGKTLKIYHRIGLNDYINAGQTFVHLDVAPMFFAPGKIWHSLPGIPKAWMMNKLEW